MTIYPAIDILGGKCVRLTQGRYDDSTVYGDSPKETALRWQNGGAAWLHLVDLDGARAGKPVNTAAIEEILRSVKIPVELGGGVRTLADIDRLIGMGVSRVILGTSAVKSRQFVTDAVKKHGGKIAVGIDAKDGMAAVSGWEEVSELEAVRFAQTMEQCGVQTIIYTDIATDGMLTGPNLAAMEEMAASVGADVIASGGVGGAADVKHLIPTGVSGVIVGRALYTGNVSLEELLCLQSG
ncbi:MAG: 1-(5-phosphoribosyl)-5-[(5-phosphoribosylamino)methylideneamino]imidazole-4-carboxamide isomerase [Clostridiales bacterium]|jgi:phosphoribosylformimino-5-aminoimidazole carboxamide ribotide isomerase|nr:1-(5-phosphoribosyl)-5-[(5-phosphoribosylamino)methylideneamino]imidazole-4-carboxamide isomerase [Clostridiales bacterium]